MTLHFKNCSLLKIIYLQIRLDSTRLSLSCETQGILGNGVDVLKDVLRKITLERVN